MHNTTDMYSQLVDHLTAIHRVTINTMPYCHNDRSRVDPVRVRAYVLSPRVICAIASHVSLRPPVACMCASRTELYIFIDQWPHACSLYQLHALNRSLCTSSAVHAAKRTIVSCASSPKYGECNCSCRHTRQFAVTLSARVAAERTSIVHRQLYSWR